MDALSGDHRMTRLDQIRLAIERQITLAERLLMSPQLRSVSFSLKINPSGEVRSAHISTDLEQWEARKSS